MTDAHIKLTPDASPTLTPQEAERVAHAIRFLSVDAVQRANSGHPGAPLGLADVATALWLKLRFDPEHPEWSARDRFVLSCGHASMLLYSLLYLWTDALKKSDLEQFRQLDSLTPGHPEVGHTPGVEMTTGPLGQGCATTVGLAIAAERLSRQVIGSRGGADHPWSGQKTVALCSDGDLMEGVSYEAASLAGHLKLGDLMWFYDRNHISIDGETSLSFSEDVGARFLALGWRVLKVNGHNHAQLTKVIDRAWESDGRPTLVICHTHIGYGSPNKVDSSSSHGAPLGVDEIGLTREALGWNSKPFSTPRDVSQTMKRLKRHKTDMVSRWRSRLQAWSAHHPEAMHVVEALYGERDLSFEELALELNAATTSEQGDATRKLSNRALNRALELSHRLMGGSADLSGSNGLSFSEPSFGPKLHNSRLSPQGRILHFGVREHAMAAITNGVTLHGSALGFCGTFLVFSDYLRPAVRLASLSHIPSVFVLTHDSVFLGEDGPTHQPVEHAWALRLIPGVTDFRPATGAEVAAAWAWSLTEAQGPIALMLTRQTLPTLPTEGVDAAMIARGAYVVCEVDAASVEDAEARPVEDAEARSVEDAEARSVEDAEARSVEDAEARSVKDAEARSVEDAEARSVEDADTRVVELDTLERDSLTLIASGSEVGLCVEVAEELGRAGIATRVVSMPSVNRFLQQPSGWREAILGTGPRVSVEAGSTLPWRGVIGADSLCIGIDTFGASAPMAALAERFGLTPRAVTDQILSWLGHA